LLPPIDRSYAVNRDWRMRLLGAYGRVRSIAYGFDHILKFIGADLDTRTVNHPDSDAHRIVLAVLEVLRRTTQFADDHTTTP
jgi:hypothetical protein